MPAECPASANYTRPVPDSWEPLLDAATIVVGQHGYSHSAGVAMYRELARLDDNSVTAAHHYGLGLIMAGLADRLTPPVARRIASQTAESAEDAILRKAPDRAVTGIRVHELHVLTGATSARSAHDQAVAASLALPQPARLLTNLLYANQIIRRLAFDPAPDPQRHAIGLAHAATEQEIAAIRVSGLIFAGVAAADMYSLLAMHHGVPTALNAQTEPNASPAIREVISADGIRNLSLGGLNRAIARLRLDEHLKFNVISPALSLRGSQLHLQPSKLPAPQPPLVIPNRQNSLIHHDRLQCPAINVRGLFDKVEMMNKLILLDLRSV